MKIASVQIKNFRSIAQCKIEFQDLLAFIGENNAGKSNIIYALELFFNKNKADIDCDYLDPSQPIEITICFKELTAKEQEQINETHRTGDTLTIRKIYPPDDDAKTTSVLDDADTNIPPRGPQNILADTLPELYILPAIKEIPNEIKLTGTTNFGKLLTDVIENATEGFDAVDDLISKLKSFFESNDPDMPLNKVATEITEILNKQFRATKVKLAPKTLTRKDILKTLDVLIDDGHHSSIYQKGHGLQRAVIFAILCLWANKLNAARPTTGKEKKGIIIAIEEPEIYLHPQQQKIVYEILKKLTAQETEQIQAIYTTHSSFLVHVEDYKNIVLVRKKDVTSGTITAQCTEDLFTPESKEEFGLLCQFDPERNELFFARKIVFVEGDTEKMCLPIILNSIGLNPIENNISIVECAGKNNIVFFVKVLSCFNKESKLLDCVVMHDKDVPWKDAGDADKDAKERKAEAENKEINDLCTAKTVGLFVFDPDLERELGLTLNGKNKPFNARKAVADPAFTVPQRLKDFLEAHLK